MRIELKGLQDLKSLPRRIAKSEPFKYYHTSTDSGIFKSSKGKVSLFVSGAYDKTSRYGYVILRSQVLNDKQTYTINSQCILFNVKGNSINSNVYEILNNVCSWKEAEPFLSVASMKLFGGRIATKKEARKLHRKAMKFQK